MAVYIEGRVPVTDNAADITDRLQRYIFASWYVAVPVPVSYTHLDVYKRQAIYKLNTFLFLYGIKLFSQLLECFDLDLSLPDRFQGICLHTFGCKSCCLFTEFLLILCYSFLPYKCIRCV